MSVIELMELSAARAIEHATELQGHLRSVTTAGDGDLEGCHADMHELVGDIVSLRNAAELLRRQLDYAS